MTVAVDETKCLCLTWSRLGNAENQHDEVFCKGFYFSFTENVDSWIQVFNKIILFVFIFICTPAIVGPFLWTVNDHRVNQTSLREGGACSSSNALHANSFFLMHRSCMFLRCGGKKLGFNQIRCKKKQLFLINFCLSIAMIMKII